MVCDAELFTAPAGKERSFETSSGLRPCMKPSHWPCLPSPCPLSRSFCLRLRSEAHRWKTTCQLLGRQPHGMMIYYQMPFPCWIPGLFWEKQWDLLVSLTCSSPNRPPYIHNSCRVTKKEAMSVCCSIGSFRGEGLEGNIGSSFPLLFKGEEG